MASARARSVSSETASRATASGVNVVLDQLGHDRTAGDEIHHAVGVTRTKRRPIAYVSGDSR